MIRYLVDMLQEKSDEEAKYILDVGTGNGHLLFALMDAQLDEAENMTPDIIFPARLCGIDSARLGLIRCGYFSSVLAFLPLLPDSLGLLCSVLALWRTSV